MPRKFLSIFGPLLLALSLVVITILSSPLTLMKNLHQEKMSAVALTDTAFKNSLVKKQAFTDKNQKFIPFFGSSEWSRMDSMHPSVLAEKYQRSYRPYLVGKRGTQSLSQYFGMQQLRKETSGSKAVFIISPQWFSTQGTEITAVQKYLSNSQIISFLLVADAGDDNDQYAANRLLAINPSVAFASKLRLIGQGKSLTSTDKTYLRLLKNISEREEYLFSHFSYSENYQKRILPRTKGLPKKFSYEKLQKLAISRGKEGSSNNRFGINSLFYEKRIQSQYSKLKNTQVKNFYVASPEYNDFQIVLSQFAQNNMDVLFVIPPVNNEWAKYTGLNLNKYQEAVAKMKYQLESQGFNNIADFSKRGDEPYFMQDTIHLGWNGWLEMDRYVHPFIEKKSDCHYVINNYFLSKEWANSSFQP